MLRGIEAAKNGMLSTLDLHDVIANNLANVNTTGFKQSKLVFKDIQETVINKMEQTEGISQKLYKLGSLSQGSSSDMMVIDFTQGGIKDTGNPLDLAINGQGFFKIQMPDGNVGYSRNGSFIFQEDGTITTKNNMPLLDDQNSPIQIDLSQKQQKNIVISGNGTISAGKQILGKVDIVDFKDKVNIKAIGNSLYVPTNPKQNQPVTPEKYNLSQGSLESSNGNIIESMVNTINAERAYDSLNNVLQMDSKSLEKAISSVGRVQR
jgi:flagellar basal-body rod protein FlgG